MDARKPPQAIKLDQETRKIWIKNPVYISNLLENVFTFIFNAIPEGEMKKKSKESLALNQVIANIRSMFGNTSENVRISATIGAYYHTELVEITKEDEAALIAISQSMTKKGGLAFFNAIEQGKSPTKRHAALLKELLLKNGDQDLLLVARKKHTELIDKLIEATFKIIAFLNTPFAILKAKTKGDDGIEQKWQTIQKALLKCLNEIQAIKKNHNAQEKLANIIDNIERYNLVDVKNAIALQNVIYDYELRLQALRDEFANNPSNPKWEGLYLRLTGYINNVINTQLKQNNEYDPDADYAGLLHQYTLQIRDKFVTELANLKKSHADEAEQMRALISEKDQTIQDQLTRIQELERQLAPPPVPHYDEVAGMEAVQQQQRVIIPDDEVYTKESLVADLQTEIDRITKKTLTGSKDDRTKKLAALTELRDQINATMNEQPLVEIMKEFFARHYDLVTHNRGGGLKKLFNPEKPKSLQMLERYYVAATGTIILQQRILLAF